MKGSKYASKLFQLIAQGIFIYTPFLIRSAGVGAACLSDDWFPLCLRFTYADSLWWFCLQALLVVVLRVICFLELSSKLKPLKQIHCSWADGER